MITEGILSEIESHERLSAESGSKLRDILPVSTIELEMLATMARAGRDDDNWPQIQEEVEFLQELIRDLSRVHDVASLEQLRAACASAIQAQDWNAIAAHQEALAALIARAKEETATIAAWIEAVQKGDQI